MYDGREYSSLSFFQWDNIKTIFFEMLHLYFPIVQLGRLFATGNFFFGKITKISIILF